MLASQGFNVIKLVDLTKNITKNQKNSILLSSKNQNQAIRTKVPIKNHRNRKFEVDQLLSLLSTHK